MNIKIFLILSSLFFLPLEIWSQGQIQRPKKNNQKNLSTQKDKGLSIQEEISVPDAYINGHGYVDLGLPSGIKWATCNVGAKTPLDYGDYFSFGETTVKSQYTKSNYKFSNQKLGKISGNYQYDAATANWGDKWRTPTTKELQELIDNCIWQSVKVNNNENGYIVMGPNKKSIFIPTPGQRVDDSTYQNGVFFNYWSSTPLEKAPQYPAHMTNFNSIKKPAWIGFTSDDIVWCGFSVRPVSD